MAQRKIILATLVLVMLGSWAPLAQAYGFTVNTSVDAAVLDYFSADGGYPLPLKYSISGTSDHQTLSTYVNSAGTFTQNFTLNITADIRAWLDETGPGRSSPDPATDYAWAPAMISIAAALKPDPGWIGPVDCCVSWSGQYTGDGANWEYAGGVVAEASDLSRSTQYFNLSTTYPERTIYILGPPFELNWWYDPDQNAWYTAGGSGDLHATIVITQTIQSFGGNDIAVPCPPTLLLLGSGLGGLALYRRWWKFVG